jgi:hypothetical protein
VLKWTSASLGLIVVTAGGAPLMSPPAYARAGLVQGWHSHHRHHSRHHNRNWNGNRHHARIFIRIYVYNKNNNKAIAVAARPERRSDRPVLVARDADPIVTGLNRRFAGPAVTRARRTVNSPSSPVRESAGATDQGAVDGATPVD